MNILETAAHTDSGFLHPGGRLATQVLIHWLNLQPGQRILEIGCGTGATTAQVLKTGGQVIAFDRIPAMLKTAQTRLQQARQLPNLLAADANAPLPFSPATFDAVYAESVIALTDVPQVFRECARVLRPKGKLVLNERIWREAVSSEEAARINALSQEYFGIPAATTQPWHHADWRTLLAQAGFHAIEIRAVDDYLPKTRPLNLSQRLIHARHHLAHPRTFWRSLQFRLLGKRYQPLWARLVSYLFFAIKIQ